MASATSHPVLQLLKLGFAIAVLVAVAQMACEEDAPFGMSGIDPPHQAASCKGLLLDIDIDERRDGQAWDTYGVSSPFTTQKEAKPDPYGRIKLSGAVSGSERLKLRKNTFHIAGAPFGFGLAEIPLEGVTVHLLIKDKDKFEDDLIVRDQVPLELLVSEDGHFLVAPNSQVSVRARCQ